MLKSFFAALALLVGSTQYLPADTVNDFVQTNLTSDLPGVAAHLDPNLVNPWGIVAAPGGPFWVNDNGTGLSTLYNGSGTPLPLVVSVPPPVGSAGPSAPTGIVFNGTSGFGGAHFIFDTEDGTISSWSSGTNAILMNTSPAGSVYKGLASGGTGSTSMLYAANFGLGRVDVFDSSFHAATVAGGFHDGSLPAGYAPFGIQNINGTLYVTYAVQDAAKHDDVAGVGHGIIDAFDMNGNLLRRVSTGGALNSPWGLAVAPSGFGQFGGDLLVGNFGDGRINAYDPNSGSLLGTLDGGNGTPLAIEGLWGLSFGNGAQGQDLNKLYFTAGIPGPGDVEDHGLFGSVSTATPEPSPAALLLVGALGTGIFSLARRRVRRS